VKYIANPVIVDAQVITQVTHKLDDPNIHLGLDDGTVFVADASMTARYSPKPGDYVVKQEDGYVYLNPKDVFTRKYKAQVTNEVAAEASAS
jgi:hypothetical protein